MRNGEWEFLVPYLTLMREDAPQREYALRDLFNAVRYVVKTGCHWRFMPHDLPPWTAVYQQGRRWLQAGVFEQIAHDLRVILRLVLEREPQPSATIMDGRTLQSTPESGARAGYDGGKKKNGSKVHIAVDTLGNLLALKVTAANEQERAQVAELAAQVQEVTGDNVNDCLRGPRLYRRKRRAAGESTWHSVGSGQTHGSQERIYSAATPLGRRTHLRLVGSLSPPRTRL
jgi:transposase